MKMMVQVQNSQDIHQVRLVTNDREHSLDIPPRESGFGSSASGGELLFLALATCYCNDIYREATKRGIRVERVEVEVEGDFEAEGGPERNVIYRARVAARASEAEVRALMEHTDRVAEIQNTLRAATPVLLSAVEVIQG
jgi:uncharacterized OsmC-like protein